MDENQYTAPPVASAGLADNVAGALAYVTIIPAIVFLVLEPYNKRPFVRFNAFQCLGLAVCCFVLSFVFAVIPILGWFVLLPLLGLTMFITVVLCIYKAYSGVLFKLPVLGDFVEKMANQ